MNRVVYLPLEQHATTSSFAGALQCRDAGQQAPPPQDVLSLGHVADSKDHPCCTCSVDDLLVARARTGFVRRRDKNRPKAIILFCDLMR